MECGVRRRAPGLRIKNGEQRVCGESSANRAGRMCGEEIIN